ncbi:hypothetical protein [Phaeobacter sp. CAU 1743]|uniref:hypothetical protein n=1 Tax=Phaeobacter sp. CAU 1743 TaxID=3140367 RepID=UPI00325B5FA7
MNRTTEAESCTPPAAVQSKSTRPASGTQPFGLRALWLHFANDLEVRRLAKLHLRILRKQDALNQFINERQKIMNRCIRRMRRANGKN